ncbi:DUF7711 family protein [Actinoalloteichus hymeniacidonis]
MRWRHCGPVGARRSGPSRPPAQEYRDRVDAELAVSLAALGERTRHYEDRRFKPGKLEPVADALWRVSAGYLDVEASARARDLD